MTPSKQLRAVAVTEISEIRTVGQEARKEFTDYLTRFDASVKKAFEIGQEFERTRQKLQKYEGVKDTLESHASSSEQSK